MNKYCRDCAHSDYPASRGCYVCTLHRDIVTGEPLDCRWVRDAGNKCGPNAIHFKPLSRGAQE